jgi:histidinol-phosphatase (PHP family)
MTYPAVLHLHTWRCKHAVGDVAEYVAAAVAGGCRVVGMSDHTPTPDDRWTDHRMELDQLEGYLAAVAAAKAAFPQATVLAGLECEYVAEFVGFHRDLLQSGRCDYLVQGQHFAKHQGDWLNCFEDLTDAAALRAYARDCVAGMESGLYAFLAHPDIIGCPGVAWGPDQRACADEICAAAAALGVPLEINAYGLRKAPVWATDGRRAMYPWLPFWEVAAAHGCRVVLSSDAHRPEDTVAGFSAVEAWRQRFGLEAADLAARIPMVAASGPIPVR